MLLSPHQNAGQTQDEKIANRFFENVAQFKYLGRTVTNQNLGRAIAQAVSRSLPTTVAWVRARVWSCGICGGQSVAGAGFLRVLRFPLPIFIPPIIPQSPSSIIWCWYSRPVVAALLSGLGLTALRRRNKSKLRPRHSSSG
jgi:hypothetical protein